MTTTLSERLRGMAFMIEAAPHMPPIYPEEFVKDLREAAKKLECAQNVVSIHKPVMGDGKCGSLKLVGKVERP